MMRSGQQGGGPGVLGTEPAKARTTLTTDHSPQPLSTHRCVDDRQGHRLTVSQQLVQPVIIPSADKS